VFIAIEADLDVRYGAREGAACAEFSWEGFDDGNGPRLAPTDRLLDAVRPFLRRA
jgi:hypothetical protein